MGTAFAQLFAVITLCFQTIYQFVSAINNVATWTNEASGAFADTSRHDRDMALKKMMKEAGIKELPKAKPVPTLASNRTLATPVEEDKEDLIPAE